MPPAQKKIEATAQPGPGHEIRVGAVVNIYIDSGLNYKYARILGMTEHGLYIQKDPSIPPVQCETALVTYSQIKAVGVVGYRP